MILPLTVDNTALVTHQSCPRKYEYRILQGRVRGGWGGALDAGSVLHEGLAEWYRTGDLEKAQGVVEAAWEKGAASAIPLNDWRTGDKILTTLRQYAARYPAGSELFTIVGAPDRPVVERAFTLPTGRFTRPQIHMSTCPRAQVETLVTVEICPWCNAHPSLPIDYGGILDTLVEHTGDRYVLDHKTSSVFGEDDNSSARSNFFAGFKPDNQMTGYIWAGGILGEAPVKGAIINGIGWNRVAPTRFARSIVTRTPAEITEWLDNVESECNEIITHRQQHFWPQRTNSCMQYGRCTYHGVCNMEPADRSSVLEQDFIVKFWSHEDSER